MYTNHVIKRTSNVKKKENYFLELFIRYVIILFLINQDIPELSIFTLELRDGETFLQICWSLPCASSEKSECSDSRKLLGKAAHSLREFLGFLRIPAILRILHTIWVNILVGFWKLTILSLRLSERNHGKTTNFESSHH